MSDKWKKALPFLLNGIFYLALGVFTVLGAVPPYFSGIVMTVGVLVNIWFGIKWNPPEPIEKKE